jgi:hypothetical protein
VARRSEDVVVSTSAVVNGAIVRPGATISSFSTSGVAVRQRPH